MSSFAETKITRSRPAYNTLYIIEPGGTEKVEANPDAIGLKVGIIFDTSRDKQEMHFYKFICHNDSVLTITSCDTTDVDYYGGKFASSLADATKQAFTISRLIRF